MRKSETYSVPPSENITPQMRCYLNIRKEVAHSYRFNIEAGNYIDLELRSVECKNDLSLLNAYLNLRFEFQRRYRSIKRMAEQISKHKKSLIMNNYENLSKKTVEFYRERLDEHLALIDKTKSAHSIEWIVGSLEFPIYVLSELVIQSEQAVILRTQYESTLALFKKRLSDEMTFHSTSQRTYSKIRDNKYTSTVRHKRPIVKIK